MSARRSPVAADGSRDEGASRARGHAPRRRPRGSELGAPLTGHPMLPVPRKVTGRLTAIVLAGQAPVVLFGAFGARAIAGVREPERAATYLWVGLVLAVACVLAAALCRTRAGILLGWVVQVATLASAVIVPAMAVVALIFGALWITALVQGRRMDDLTRAYVDSQGGAAPGS